MRRRHPRSCRQGCDPRGGRHSGYPGARSVEDRKGITPMTQPVDYATPAVARFYTPGAKFDVGRTALALPVAVLLAVAVGAAYGLTLFEISSIYLRVAAACAAAAAVGLLTAGMLRVGR